LVQKDFNLILYLIERNRGTGPMTFQQPHFNVTVLNPADLILKDEDGRVKNQKGFYKKKLPS
jgi:hypothetical protein